MRIHRVNILRDTELGDCSNNGITFVTPTGASAIASSFSKTSGPSANGCDIFSFSPPLCRYLKLQATETGSSNGYSVTTTLAYQ